MLLEKAEAQFTKADAQIYHALQRAKERYSINLSIDDYLDLVRQIQNGEAKFVERQSNRVTLFEIQIKNFAVVVVYDKKRHVIVTFLPPEAVQQKRDANGLKIPCPSCEGKGEVRCRRCDGTGKFKNKICPSCDGGAKCDCGRCEGQGFE
jgi:hypothetical protein